MLFQKKVLFYITVATVFLGTFAVSSSCGNRRAAQGVDTLKVNTKELAADVMGFNGRRRWRFPSARASSRT